MSDAVRKAEMALMEAKALDYEPLSDEEFERVHTEAQERRREEWHVMINAHTAAMGTITPVLKTMQDEIETLRQEAIYWRARARRAEAPLCPAPARAEGGRDE